MNPASNQEFIHVKRKRGKSATLNFRHNVDSSESLRSLGLNSNSKLQDTFCLTNDDIIKKLKVAQSHLEVSGFFSHFQGLVAKALQALDPLRSPNSPKILKIVCLGLGSFSDCIIARYQLALLTLLQTKLEIGSVELFDPIFSDQENAVLEELGFHVLTINEEGRRCVENDLLTLFYLPHCSHQLTNNLLFANWNIEKLKNCVIISNSFANIHNSVPPRILSQSLSFISRAGDICEEFEVKNCFEYSDIFNDTSIHVFSKLNAFHQMNDFWLDCSPPVYLDSDFVKSSCIEDIKPNQL
ncbi:SRR1-like protein [Folsomia candida]|uniref:SRR1-like protein n=1 Tax=Folsomia candida TaxID=158441 RepID=A0A226EZN5_FOLCA|nr:SRR1-like protein [Folsomia candida]OXA62604.1 SRR1-like protein [Folsomia candida]